ncbi:MAG: hypothetical protein CMB80_05765 [Flammeovirgaceae bacterium]|nr:hypothetical protein [Flammeovirgaceae bacterium]
MSYVNLHSHSSVGSTMDGMSDVEGLVKRAVEIGAPAQALTDHGRMSGVVRLYKACQEYGLLPLIGTEAYVKHDDIDKQSHLVLMAGNTEGLHNLYELSSLAFSNPVDRRPCLTHQMIEDHNAGIICLSACMSSELGRFIQGGKLNAAKKLVQYYKEVFGDRYFLELQNQNAGKIDEVQAKIAKATLDLGSSEGVTVVATNDSHYTCSEDKYLHEIMMAASDKEGMLDAYAADLSLLDRDKFKEKLEVGLTIDADQYIDNTLKVVAMAEDMGAGDINPLRKTMAMPKFVPKDTKFEEYGKKPDDIIREYCHTEIESRFPKRQWTRRKERLEVELEVIIEKNFCDYFLIVADYVSFCKRRGYVVGPGRGSGASSLVSYLLDITEVDPQRYGLLFERMLNHGRPDNEPPDFDIDFSPEVRETLIGYLCHKYGDDHVIRVGTFNTLQLKGIIRELGRNLGADLGLVNAFCKSIPFEVKSIAELKEVDYTGNYTYPNVQEYLRNAELKTVIKYAEAMSDKRVVKSEGLHAAGVIISSDPIRKWSPTRMTRTPEGALVQVTQFDMDDLGDIGLIKFDLLKLSAVTAITEACKLIKDRHNVSAELEHIPTDIANNRNVYRLYHEGRTRGVFQLTGNPSIRQFFVNMAPVNISEIATGISVYRPGLMDYETKWPGGGTHNAMQEFLKRRKDPSRIVSVHPTVDKILKETQGIVVFQEQIMQMAVECAGYTLTDADRLRIAVGKKKEDKIQEEKPIFIAGATKNLGSKKLANKLWEEIVTFARYGFNKSHAVSYGLISYHTAWLKANYPQEFYVSSINADVHKREKIAELIEDAREYKSRAFPKGIEVLPPDITSREFRTTIEDRSIRLGVGIVKGISEKAGEYLRHCDDSMFASPEAFFTNVHWQEFKSASIQSLIKMGSFDALIGKTKRGVLHGRAQLLALMLKVGASTLIREYLKALDKSDFDGDSLYEKVGNFIEYKIAFFQNRDQEKETNQVNLKKWEDIKLEFTSRVLTTREILYEEQVQLGFYLSGNPMVEFSHLYDSSTITNLEDVEVSHDGSVITCPIVINEMKVRSPKKGKGNRYGLLRVMDSSRQVEGSISFWGDRNEKDIGIGDVLVADLKIDFIQTLEGAETFRVRVNDYRKVGNLSDPTERNYSIRVDVTDVTVNKIFELSDVISNTPKGLSDVTIVCDSIETEMKSVLVTPSLNVILNELPNVEMNVKDE